MGLRTMESSTGGGGRNGAIQANFIRLKQTGKAGRYNVHIDVRD